MQNLKYIFLLFLGLSVFTACEYEPLEDEDALSGIETGDPFVRFATGQGGASGVENEVVSLTVEFTFPIETNITVDYSLGGDATFGEDYTIAGASSGGGSVELVFDPDETGTTTTDIDIQLLTDCVLDGGEMITLTLTAARADNGTPINAGQGPVNRELSVMIEDDADIVAIASNLDDFSILAAAVDSAGLVSTLSGGGPFTTFAPVNEAFVALLDSNPDWNGLEDIPLETLTSVLTYHVVGQTILSSTAATGYLTTLSAVDTLIHPNATLSLYFNTDSGVSFNDGSVTATDFDCEGSNGVIHTIDGVLLPPNIVTFATSDPNFSLLVEALTATGLMTDFVEVLSGPGPFTVFAPTNDAFQALLDSNPDWNAISDIPVATLEEVLLYHVVGDANVRSGDLMDDMEVTTLSGGTFTIDLDEGAVINAGSNSANIILTDVQGTNGVIHAIDTVILP